MPQLADRLAPDAQLSDRRTRHAFGLVWSGAFAFFFSFYLLLSTLPLYARGGGMSDGAIGLIIGAFALTSMVVKPWAGWACDHLGRKPLLLAGSAIFLIASLAYGVGASTLSLLLVRLIHGAGMGLFPTAASAVVADLAPLERRGEYLGFFGAAANIAMALGPITGMIVVEHLGFEVLFGLAAVSAGLALLVSAGTPETLGQPRRLPFRLTTTLSRAALFPSLIVLLLMITYGALVSFLPLFAHQQGMNPGLFFLVFALVAAVVRGHAGRLSDRLGRVPVTVTGLLLAAAALVTVAVADNGLGLAAAGALYGIGFGSAQPALMAWCVDQAEPADRGRAIGTYYMAYEMGIAVGATSAGLGVGMAGFAATFLVVAGAAVAGALQALAARRPSALRPSIIDAA